MAKAVFAGKHIKKLTAKQCFSLRTLFDAVFAGFPEYLFVRNRPGNAGNGDSY